MGGSICTRHHQPSKALRMANFIMLQYQTHAVPHSTYRAWNSVLVRPGPRPTLKQLIGPWLVISVESSHLAAAPVNPPQSLLKYPYMQDVRQAPAAQPHHAVLVLPLDPTLER